MSSNQILQYSLKAVLLLLCSQISAQIADYPLADYVRPDLQRITSFYGGTFSIRNQQNKLIGQELDTDFSLSLSPRWRQTVFKNTERHQIQSWISLDLRMNYSKDNDFQKTINIFELNPIIRRGLSKKTFFKNTNFFDLGYGVVMDETALFYRDTINDSRDVESEFRGELDLSIYFGKGRIELVNDAWHAHTILEMLEEQDLLEKSISVEQIEAFANRISEIKNFRNTDFRLEGIAEFESLCEHLVENGIMDAEKYRSFAVLLDAWQYESFINRESGNEWKFGLKSKLMVDDKREWLGDNSVLFTNQVQPTTFLSAVYLSLIHI